MMLPMRKCSKLITCDEQANIVQDRIILVEKNFAALCTIIAAYSRKAARLRDKNDELAQVLKTYADTENMNTSLSVALTHCSMILLSLGDFQDARVQKLDNKVVTELSQYEIICKHAKDELKHTFNARDKEITRKRQLDRLRERNPRNRQQISQAESQLVKATAEVSRTVRTLEDQIDEFERQKSRNLKNILLEFVLIEISFHAKSLELLTKAYQSIDNIDEQLDVEEFRSMLQAPQKLSRLETVKRMSFKKDHSQSMGTLNVTVDDIKDTKPVSKSMESMDSFKIAALNDSTNFGTSTEDDSTNPPIPPIIRRIV